MKILTTVGKVNFTTTFPQELEYHQKIIFMNFSQLWYTDIIWSRNQRFIKAQAMTFTEFETHLAYYLYINIKSYFVKIERILP